MASLGCELDDVWPHFATYLATVSLNFETGAHACEAIIVAAESDEILLAIPGAVPTWQTSVEVSVDTDGLEFREPRRCFLVAGTCAED